MTIEIIFEIPKSDRGKESCCQWRNDSRVQPLLTIGSEQRRCFQAILRRPTDQFKTLDKKIIDQAKNASGLKNARRANISIEHTRV